MRCFGVRGGGLLDGSLHIVKGALSPVAGRILAVQVPPA